MTNCTHGPTAHLNIGDRCSICGTVIVSFVAERSAVLATRGGEGVGSALTLEAHRGLPAAHIAANPVSPIARAAAAAPEADPAASGAPIAASAPTVASVPSILTTAGQSVSGSLFPDARRTGADAAPIARNTDPQAAHDAAARAAHDYTFDQWLVLAAHVASRDLNGDELGAVCGRPYQSVGPRRPALERNRLIEETGTRRKGKGCYRATDAGRAAWRDCPESIRPTVLAQLTNTAVMALRGAA